MSWLRVRTLKLMNWKYEAVEERNLIVVYRCFSQSLSFIGFFIFHFANKTKMWFMIFIWQMSVNLIFKTIFFFANCFVLFSFILLYAMYIMLCMQKISTNFMRTLKYFSNWIHFSKKKLSERFVDGFAANNNNLFYNNYHF